MSLFNKKIPDLPEIPERERTPLVNEILETCSFQKEQLALKNEIIQALKDEIARLKGEKPKPDIKPSNLEKGSGSGNNCKKPKKRPGSKKRKKNRHLKIHDTISISPDNIPEGSRFKGYDDYIVQDLVIKPYNIRFRMQRWQTPSGEYITGKLPEHIKGHYNINLIRYILHQYYHADVTQPLILEQLLEFGIDISSGQVNRIINENKDIFHAEKDEILTAGLDISDYVHVDDTGARHQGRNGYCTHIGNELFAWFESTQSKSRINFLTLLRGKHTDYVLNEKVFEYMQAQKLPQKVIQSLTELKLKSFQNEQEWSSALNALDVVRKRHIRIATEGALIGSVLEHGFNPRMVIISDDAGQFNIFLHALCWIHAERTINKLVGFNEQQRQAVVDIQNQLWKFYSGLKSYKENPCPTFKKELEEQFDQLFTTRTYFASLNLALQRIYKNKSELLLVLQRPEIPLHNNLSENDIRGYVKKKKISGGTRSEVGRRCRDTFSSLKKTCRKLGISLWDYLKDRLSGNNTIPKLSDCMRYKANASPG